MGEKYVTAFCLFAVGLISFDSPAEGARSPTPPPDQISIKAGVMRWVSAYKSEGMTGARIAVDSCFRRLGRTPTYSALDYCFSIDLCAHEIDSGLAKKIGFPPDEYFSMAAVLNRAQAKLKRMPGSEMEKDRHVAAATDVTRAELADVVLSYGQ
jgi:hypothetical protein